MALIEEVPEDADVEVKAISKTELLVTLRALAEKLRLPSDLLPSFMADYDLSVPARAYRTRAEVVLQQIQEQKEHSAWAELSIEEQGEIFGQITRLYGDEVWTSAKLVSAVDEIALNTDTSKLALHLLAHTLRPLFTASHPMLNPQTARALSRPAGGPDAMSDLQNDAAQIWKSPDAWGCHNVLAWCCAHLAPADIPNRIGLILPPTLMLIDDWDPAWRGRGVWVLDKWMRAISPLTMKRMGMDRLLLKSLTHILSTHPTTPLPHVMPVTLDLVGRTTEGEKRAEALVDIMNKAILSGWMYAPSGAEGRVVLIQIAKDLELLCGVMKSGIVRWMKSIIPNLLQPLSFLPTPAVLPHFEANLSALLCVLRHVGPTGRVPRWRGQILDVMSRLCVHLDERENEQVAIGQSDRSGALAYLHLRSQVSAVFGLLAELCPSVGEDEYARLEKLDGAIFRPYMEVRTSQPIAV